MTEIGHREPITKANVNMLVNALGFGATILDLHLVDYSRGALQVGNREKCFWLTDGRRIDISMTSDGGVIASTTKEADPNRPDPLIVVRDMK